MDSIYIKSNIMESKDYPRVLVISHNPFSKVQNNGKTLAAFFEGWPSERLAQLFITGNVTETDLCNNFYKISEKKMLKRVLFKKTNVGEVCDKAIYQNDNSTKLSRLKIKNQATIGLFRDMLWALKLWNTKSLNTWIDNFNPDIVFYQSSSDSFMFDFVDYICKSRKIPLIMETTDDYLSLSKYPSFSKIIHQKRIFKRYRNAVLNSYCVFAISEFMAVEYKQKFGGNFKVAMNCAKPQQLSLKPPSKEVFRITYAGNLGLNRWRILSRMGKYLEELYDINVEFSIYSLQQPSNKVLKSLTIDKVMRFKGKANKDELEQIINDTDLLIHVESFDMTSKHITRLSISTKIPEYLLSKRPILAIGPSDVASIKYLKDNDLAFVLSDFRKIEFQEKIKRIILDSKMRDDYALRSYRFASKNHNIDLVKESIQNSIFKAVNEFLGNN